MPQEVNKSNEAANTTEIHIKTSDSRIAPKGLTVRAIEEVERAEITHSAPPRETTAEVINKSFMDYIRRKFLCCGAQSLDDESLAQSSSGLRHREVRFVDRPTDIELDNMNNIQKEIPVLKEFKR